MIFELPVLVFGALYGLFFGVLAPLAVLSGGAFAYYFLSVSF